MIKQDIPVNDENRKLYQQNHGILYASKNGIEKLQKSNPEYIHEIKYEDLIREPDQIMKNIYEYLDLPYFKHNFENIESIHKLRDFEVYGIENMHKIKSSIEIEK